MFQKIWLIIICLVMGAVFSVVPAAAENGEAEKPEYDHKRFQERMYEEDQRYVAELLAACEPEVTGECLLNILEMRPLYPSPMSIQLVVNEIKTWPKQRLYALALAGGSQLHRHNGMDANPNSWVYELNREIGKIIGPPPKDPAADRPPYGSELDRMKWKEREEQRTKICPSEKRQVIRCQEKGGRVPLCAVYQEDEFLRQGPEKNKQYLCYLNRSLSQCGFAESLKMFQSLPGEILREFYFFYDCKLINYDPGWGQERSLMEEAMNLRGQRRTAVGYMGDYLDGGSGSGWYLFHPTDGLPPLLINLARGSTVDLRPRPESPDAQIKKEKIRIYYSFHGTTWNGYPEYEVTRIEPAGWK